MRPYIYRKCLLSYLRLHILQVSDSTILTHILPIVYKTRRFIPNLPLAFSVALEVLC